MPSDFVQGMHVPILCVNDFAEEMTRLSELAVADAAARERVDDD
jgi:hypothetical protein